MRKKRAERLGIGQPTLREALHELEHQGLLRKTHQRGTNIAKLSPEDFRLIQEVRIPLKAIEVGKGAEDFTPAADQEFTAILEAIAASGTSEIETLRDSMNAMCLFIARSRNWRPMNIYEPPWRQSHFVYLLFPSLIDGQAIRKQSMSTRLWSRNTWEFSRDYAAATRIRHEMPLSSYWNAQYGLGIREEEMDLTRLVQ